jgi:hypothetical protein
MNELTDEQLDAIADAADFDTRAGRRQIANAIIATHEAQRQAKPVSAFLKSQEPLGADFAKVLVDNLDALYSRTEPVQRQAGQEPVGYRLIPAGSIHKSHLEPTGEPWCKEILFYSPTNPGDFPEKRVTLYTAAPPPAQVPESWISVDKDLPEMGVAVLGLIRNSVGVYMRDDGGGDGWMWAQQQNYWDLHGEGFACDDDYEVTHWQHLPAAPDCPR